jgi:DNA-binding CsgD family transcriptional regulator/tetratricopeptide (TPR) repeat protein
MKSRSGPPLVGREAELGHLESLLRDARRGTGAVVTISGDHGAGKTALAREVADRARRRDALVLWGRGYDDQGSPAYWPWAEIVSAYRDAVGAQHAGEVLGPAARDIEAAVPGLERGGAGGNRSSEPPSSEARYRLFSAMRSFVRRASAETPLVIVLDDLHYCDPDTLRLFAVVAEDLKDRCALLLGTYVQQRAARNSSLSGALADLAKLSWHHRLNVDNLRRSEVHRLLELQCGGAVNTPLADSVHERTEGNPLFVLEVARHLGAGGEEWLLDAAESVAILIGRRLERLAAGSARLLKIAAVRGREVHVPLLARAASTNPAVARELLLEPAAEGFLDAAGVDRYRFAHEIVQRAIESTLTPAERAAAHLAAGEALEALAQDGVAVEPGLLAWHFAEAGDESRDKAARYLQNAGQRALEAAAYDTALRCFEGAAAHPLLAPSRRAELAMLRAWALFALTRFLEVTPCLAEAFELYSALGDIDHAVDAAAFDLLPQATARLPLEDMRRLCERALGIAAPGSRHEARLLCALGDSCSCTQPDRAEACFAHALESARAFADRRLEARVLHARAWMEFRQLRLPAFLATAAHALQAAREARDRDLEVVTGGWLAMWRLLCCDVASAERLAAELRAAGHLRQSPWTYQLDRAERCLALWQGRWLEPEKGREVWMTSRGAYRALPVNPAQPLTYFAPRELLDDLEKRAGIWIPPDDIGWRASQIAFMSRGLGDLSCLAEVEALARRALASSCSPYGRLCALVALGYVGMLRGDRALLVEACGPDLAAAPGGLLLNQVWYMIDAVRGLFYGLLGRNDEARLCFERAITLARRGGLVRAVHTTGIDYAAFLLRLGERDRARDLVEEAHACSVGQGMRGLASEIAALKQILEGAAPDGLTERELQVIRLVAAGRSTKQIAGELYISVHTATNHLRHIYSKTGVNNRVDLAGYAVRHHIAAAIGDSSAQAQSLP